MTVRRRVLLGLLLVPGAALAQGRDQGKGRGKEKDRGAGGARPKAATAGKPDRAAARRHPPAGGHPGEDLPALHPVDREQVSAWLAANPDWAPPGLPPGERRRPAPGRPLPSGIAAQPLPPGLAATLPYFPGYRYVAVGPDIVLVATADRTVTSLLAGALAR
ncbi:hypothetical protein [Paracraurococcus lichenis]|uniref:RcnB family protein n=1 Tax=Paracraurococcus lichenis TaxID=3064888 RepID=A0ABT9E3G7_9PROT|nr:hypothetical protein [Paracraurococcus sp. LOR1-02]MDO9710706.1 hypothetical protein [Paracraurococcus sp. LOR1-02]